MTKPQKLLPIRGCIQCLKGFRPKRHWQRFCSGICRQTAKKEEMKAEYACEYCGLLGDTIDHIPPLSIRPILVDLKLDGEYLFHTVRACDECNSALSDLAYWDVEQRKEYIYKWIKQRYHKYLTLPNWSELELQALDYSLQKMTRHGLTVKAIALRRLERAKSTNPNIQYRAITILSPKTLIQEKNTLVSESTCNVCNRPTEDDILCSLTCQYIYYGALPDEQKVTTKSVRKVFSKITRFERAMLSIRRHRFARGIFEEFIPLLLEP